MYAPRTELRSRKFFTESQIIIFYKNIVTKQFIARISNMEFIEIKDELHFMLINLQEGLHSKLTEETYEKISDLYSELNQELNFELDNELVIVLNKTHE